MTKSVQHLLAPAGLLGSRLANIHGDRLLYVCDDMGLNILLGFLRELHVREKNSFSFFFFSRFMNSPGRLLPAL